MPRMMDALARLMPGRTRTAASTSAAGIKASAVGPLIAFDSLRRPVWTPRDYAAFAREGFMQNAVVYRSVRMIAEAAASVPLVLYDGAQDIDQHPLLDLIANPSPGQTQAGFFEAWYGYLLVSGNAYAEAAGIGSEVRELHALRPDRMKVVPGSDGWPEAYEYTVNGRTVRFDRETVPGVQPILHMRLFHPDNDYYGMSPIEAASTAIDIHNAASVWNKALLDNSARPSGALVYAASDGRMTAEQFERLKSEMEQGFTGPKQAGRPLLLEGGLDWKPLSLSPKDMDFIESKNAAAREIALALGVPPMLLGIPGDNTYSNYQEANRSFWRQTVLPLVHRSARAFAAWLAPSYGGALTLRPDLDQIEALSSEREALWARLDRATFLTVDEKRAAVGYGPLPETPPPFDGAGDAPASLKYSEAQPRAAAGTSTGGQWTDSGGGSSSARSSNDNSADKPVQEAQARSGGRRVRSGSSLVEMTPGQEARYNAGSIRAQDAVRRVQEYDPAWKPEPTLSDPNSAESQIASIEVIAAEAEARFLQLQRSAVPNTSPAWGVTRLRKELNGQGYIFDQPTDSPGYLYIRPLTGEQVRIMQRPRKVNRNDSDNKHQNDYYYRYRSADDQAWREHITIPNKEVKAIDELEVVDHERG